ncbi:MAG: hypothetical protein WC343_06675, partial [Bacilli bacterium]
IGAAAQASLEQNFGIEVGPKPQEYFQTAAAVPVTVREREAAHARLQGVIDPINAAIEAGTPASELPFLPAGITRMARDAGADPGFDAWAFQYTATVARAKAGDLPSPDEKFVQDTAPTRDWITENVGPYVTPHIETVRGFAGDFYRGHIGQYDKFMSDTAPVRDTLGAIGIGALGAIYGFAGDFYRGHIGQYDKFMSDTAPVRQAAGEIGTASIATVRGFAGDFYRGHIGQYDKFMSDTAPVRQTGEEIGVSVQQRIDTTTELLPATSRIGASFVGGRVGRQMDTLYLDPARAIIPELPSAEKEFTERPEELAKGVIIGGAIVGAVAGGATLIGAGGAGAASAGSAPAVGEITFSIGGSATGLATQAAAPVVIEEGLKAAAAAGAVMLGGEMVRRTIEFPSGLPDWAEFHKDPHGGVGQEGSEIPLPDWMSGDPEVLIDPGVDWRAPGEPFDEYMRYRRSLPGEGPPGTGPTPYYPGPELTIGGRTIHAPEITPSPDYFGAPEWLIGRTIHAPEIEPDTARKQFAPEIPIPSSGELFPGELPRRTGLDTGPTISPDQAPIHPLGDPVSPVWRPPDYTDTLGIVSAGITLPGSFRRSIPHHRPIEPLLPSDGGIHESLRVRPFKTPSKRRKAQKEEEIDYDYTFTPIPPEVPQVTVPGIITPRPDSGITTKFTPIHTAGIEAKARPGVISLSPVKPLHIATPDATAVSGVDVRAGVAAGTLAASVTGTLSGVASVSATRPAVATLPRLARPNISRIEYQPETVNITTPIFARGRTRRDDRRDDRRRRRDKWDEFYLDYAEAPNPLASLEEAYTDAPAPKIRPAKIIKNIDRITIGTPPKIQPIRATQIRTGKPIRRARQTVPWDVPTLDLDSLTALKPKRKNSKRRRR